ncbi:SEC14 cytosolic factor [Seminavis robusta]|uniref:SEC14 cytosolic factor n=1 Tax=Seminavis robusta TaxID=568900 RepID=A0A9N8H9R5_9STRA|nr:SEC14 cytosolic factor [Seminavis robusta]|eukprot:Sro265_g102760.1 SEC14 cytosolic factor (291) ;mRNA; r:22815-23759
MTKDDINCNLEPEVEAQGVKDILEGLTEEEKAALADDEMPLRHFRAEKGNVKKALKQIKATIKWRDEFQVVTLRDCFRKDEAEANNDKEGGDRLTAAEFQEILRQEDATGKIYVRGYDKDGRAVVYMQPSRENTKHETNNMRHLVWNMEKAIAISTRQGYSKIAFVIDYTGFSLWNAPPLSTNKYTLDIMQRHYPERCHRFYLTNAPFWFKAFWGTVRPFVDAHTKEKIVMCTSGNKDVWMESLGGDPARLEPFLDGTHTYEFNVDEYFALPFDAAVDDDMFDDIVVKKE